MDEEILTLIAIIAAIVLMPLLLMWCWNWLMPVFFGLAKINFWQSLGILVLFKILF